MWLFHRALSTMSSTNSDIMGCPWRLATPPLATVLLPTILCIVEMDYTSDASWRRRRRQNEIKSPAVQTHTRSDDVVLDIVDGDIEVDGGPRSKRKPTLDLHGMSRQQALQEVPQFIQNAKTRYHNENGSRHVNIITGRGLHSENRFPVLKVETKKFLERVGLKFFSNSKGGQLVVDLKS
ncbi:hypothetical protein Btru_039666 [Bulinus truncatus]|nr:hypothetical protein Btru_039666 [Bulinus truncatus]